jgi:hypothetical protein
LRDHADHQQIISRSSADNIHFSCLSERRYDFTCSLSEFLTLFLVAALI